MLRLKTIDANETKHILFGNSLERQQMSTWEWAIRKNRFLFCSLGTEGFRRK